MLQLLAFFCVFVANISKKYVYASQFAFVGHVRCPDCNLAGRDNVCFVGAWRFMRLCVWPAIRMAMTPFPSTTPPGNAMAVNQGRHWATQYMSRIQRMPSYMDMFQHVHALCPFLIAALPIAFCTRVSGKLRECALYLIEFAQMQMVLLSFNQIPCAFLIFLQRCPSDPVQQ